MIELLFEIVLQVFVEFLGELVAHMLPASRRSWNAILAFIGYAAAGVAVGYLTPLLARSAAPRSTCKKHLVPGLCVLFSSAGLR